MKLIGECCFSNLVKKIEFGNIFHSVPKGFFSRYLQESRSFASSMTYRNKRWALISLCLLVMTLGAYGAITMGPSNTAVLNGTSRVVMFCTSDNGYQVISWGYFPVGSSAVVEISFGPSVYDAQQQYYAVNASGPQQSNLTILSATTARAGTYYCSQGFSQQVTAQLIVINSNPVCSMTPNAPTELMYDETVKMNCSVSYTANTSYVAVDMTWSNGSTASSSPPQTSTTANLTTAVSTITQTPGNFTPFPIYSCNTSFRITGIPLSGSTNVPDYSKSTPLFNSPINVVYLKPANESSVTGAGSGGSVYLGTTVTCNVEANPPANYSWLDVTYRNTTNSSSIQIWHSGEYQCTAWNRAASTSASINVTTYITTTTSTTTTTTMPMTSVTSLSTNSSSPSVSGGLSETNKIIIGVVVGVGGALLIGAVALLIYCCLKKKNKADKYTNPGSLGKPPPYDDGYHGPQRSANPDLVQGYQLDDYPQQQFSPYSNQQSRPRIEDDGLNYAQIQLDNNPRSRQPLQVTDETNYTDVRLA